MVISCPSCGHGNDDAAKFCSECGAKLTTPTTPSRQIRKTVTVVFCDVTGSTALGERLDPETLRGVMTRYFDRMKAVLESHGGTVEKFNIASQAGIELARGLIGSGSRDPSAREHLQRALALDDSSDMLGERAETRLDVAEALSGEDPEGARALVREAIELARTKQATVLERRAEELLARLGG